ncbi:MAG TPA: hypothetical protein ENN36_09095 [Candidatus Bathyarchaeota archaeon]|nr:hypothetical protein [Candidatus Bathyarchaeota archaeon]
MNDSNSKESAWQQVRAIVLLPLTIFLWMTGWILYGIGTQRMASRTTKKKSTTASKKRRL